jgi:hypothetical protein
VQRSASRLAALGFVSRENIIGQPLAPTSDLNSASVSFSHLVDLRRTFSKTWWNRSFIPVHGYPVR